MLLFRDLKNCFLPAFDDSYIKNNNIIIHSNERANNNVLIDGRNFYDKPTDNQIFKYDEIRKIAAGDDYRT